MTITLKQIKELTEGEIINYQGRKALEMIKQDAYDLKHVHNQTLEICLAAVKENPYALQYVHNQTLEICLAAVKENGYVLQHVHNQTPEICLAAVKENPDAFKYVNPTIFEDNKFYIIDQIKELLTKL